MGGSLKRCVRLSAAVLLGVFLQPAFLLAQGTGEATTSESSVGYIDSALPRNVIRLRADAAYDSNRASRAEMFYAQTGPRGPGLPFPETSVDYQELSFYLEGLVAPQLSVFVETPVRFLNPVVNDNSVGLGDITAGFKYAFINCEDRCASFQLRTFAPSGEADRGLGTRHVSLEPAFLFYTQPYDRLALESELRLWVPIGGTDFAGEVFRYGVGVSYALWQTACFQVRPVGELVGWTVL